MSPYDPNFPYGGSNVITPETGAGKYWYVDPNAQSNLLYQQQSKDADENEQFANLLEILKRLGFTPQEQQPQEIQF